MYRSVCVPAALLLLLLIQIEVSRGQTCPRSCNCYQANEVHCTFRSLLTIPPGLPAYTRRINLGFNSISRLHNRSLAGLNRAELLMLHSNDLYHLPDAVFKDMKSLQILKLSYNKLREISSSLTFSGLTSVLRLYLDHNFLQHIHPRALLQLPSLRLLRLQGNRLHQLHPHALCTLSLLNTYYFSTLRHLDLSNNSLTTLPKDSVTTAPLLETLILQANPWSCDCRMNWLHTWSLAHPGLMKCPNGPQCPVCASPTSVQGLGLLDQTSLLCTSPIIISSGKETSLETDLSEIQSSETFREPLGSVSLGLSDQQGNNVDLSCNITHSTDSQNIAPPPDLSLTTSSSLPLVVSLSLECPIEGKSYEKLWRILAYYSETAARLEREIMLSKAPALAYRYRQAAETDGYYHTGVKASVKARPQWLLQPAISIQLNRAQSNRHKVQLMYSTRVSAHPDPISRLPTTSSASHPWVLISTNSTTTALAAVAGSKVELSCPLLSSGNPKVRWILPNGSKLISPSTSSDGRLRASASGLRLQKVHLSDAGIYYCIAWAGRDLDVLPLRLAVEESSAPHSGELVRPSVSGVVGEAVSLSCRVSGSPEPNMSWILPDGNLVRWKLAVSGGVTIQSNGSLSILNPSPRDEGYYRCIAVNQYGSYSTSMQLNLNSQHISLLKTSFPRGPQSAAGRSTKIRAPLFHQVDEGSGNEEEEEEEEEQKTPRSNRRYPISLRPHPNKRYPAGKLQRRGPLREGPLRRGGGPISSSDQQRNRFQNRHRITTNKQRIDPQKWADLLAKIRQKTANTSNTQHTTGNPIAEPVQGGKDKDTREHKGSDDNRVGAQGAGEETETEGSSVDDTVLEEQPQPTQPASVERWTKKDAGVESGTERSIEKEIETNTETEAHIQTGDTDPQIGTTEKPVTQKEQVTFNPMYGTNEIILEPSKGDERGANQNPFRTRPQIPRQGLLPNLVPNSRPQSPWNSRRRIGHRRRIHRPRVHPVTPPEPLPEPVDPRSQTVSPDSTTDQIDVLLTVSTATHLLTPSDHIRTTPNSMTLNPLSSLVSDAPDSPPLNSASSSATPSPAHTDTNTDMITSSFKTPQTEEFPLNIPSASTPSNIVISETHVPDTYDRTLTHAIQTPTETQTALGKHPERPPSKHREELERNVLGESHFSTTHSFIVSSVPSESSTATTATKILTSPSATLKRDSYAGRTESTSTFTTSEDTFSTIATATTKSPTIDTSATIFKSTSNTTRKTSTTPTSTTTTNTPTPTPTITTATSTSSPTTSIASTSTTTFSPITYTFSTTTDPSATASSATISLTTIPRTSKIPTSAISQTTTSTIPTTTTPLSAKIPSATTMEFILNKLSTTITMASTSTKASSRDTPTTGQVDPRVRLVSGAPNQSQHSVDWKNSGANYIPDSHSSRSHRPPSSSLPAAPVAPVLRSRPRIADPHIRTVSFPAQSTARLACEAQGEPKPFITWTKVTTGAVMSIHSRAQRFEVLPNGTLVIENVQLQDRGTYICSANSFLGRDRLLTTLEVWTRPPRMQLASYREVTIHQGGRVHLECRADGVPTPLLSWVLPDRSTLTSIRTSSSRMSMDTNGTLHISVTLPSDRGVYRCVASNSAGAASASVRVHVSSLPPVIQQPRQEHLLFTPGWPVYVHCSARGAPPPTLRWRIPDGTLIRPSQFLNGNLFVLPNGTLHIRSVGPKDTGNYECTAINTVGSDMRTVRVKLEGEADLERGQGGEINQGIKQVSSDKPSPSSSLNKDRTSVIPSQSSDLLRFTKLSPLYPSDRYRNLLLNPSPSNSPSNSLPKINKTDTASPTHLTNIKKTNPFSLSTPSPVPANNTKVSQSINNTRVSSSLPADRKTSTALQTQPISPFTKARIVSTSPSTSTVHYGGILQLHCSVTGNPAPIIIWRTPNRKLVDMHYSFDQRLKVHPNGTLSVQVVTEKDAGDYLCIARNKVADDYRLLRVTVATKPAKIEPKQPFNHMVSFGKPLKVDCQATGLPEPTVRWSLPDGTTVNSVLHGEDRGVRTQRLTVYDNGTLLVPVMGMEEEGEYTCYVENQGGQDTMKVKVKVMMTSPPTFTADRSYHLIKVHQGTTAAIPCQAAGYPTPTVTWFSPAHRIIPQSLGSGYYSERVVVVSGGTLEIRSVQKVDTGNYICRARNSAGERSMVVRLEVEASTTGISSQAGGGGVWSTNNERGGSHGIRSGDYNTGIIRYGSTGGISSKLGGNNVSSNNYTENNGRIRNTIPNSGINLTISGFNPALRSDSQHGFKRPVSGITAQPDSSGITVELNGAQNIGIKADSTGMNGNGAGIMKSSHSLGNNQSSDRRDSGERNPGTNDNEVITGRTSIDAKTSRDNSSLSDNSRNVGSSGSSLSDNRTGSSTLRGNSFSRTSNLGGASDSRKKSGGLSGIANTAVGEVTTVKQRAVKGQTVLLPCPSQGFPPPRLAWLLPGNGMLPAPYYGSRLTVHRNGSLELRGVRVSDSGTLVCVVKSEQGETLIRVELEVLEQHEGSRPPQSGPAEVRPHAGHVANPAQSLNSRPVSPVQHLQRGLSLTVTPHPMHSPPSTGPVSEPTVNTRTAPLVSTINGETLRLPCPPSQTQGSLSWTLPSGKVLSKGESGDSGRYVVHEDGTLIVEQASVFDRGTYTCRFSSHDSYTVSVVTVSVIIIAYPPRITTGPSPVTYTRIGVAVELPCLTIATPRATVTWETPDLTQLRVTGQPRLYGNRYLSPQGSLVIQNPTPRDTGFYRCTAKNVIGVDSKATYLHVM
ncbi:matrix-remodeling-associated protein 5-like [Odontesthes bonariensis]|uniref:matrix-remodeling-associated protein 5-like n=1 Tax=Odontesthes bonariensis TaxID=219752 RepID=UPI003F587873